MSDQQPVTIRIRVSVRWWVLPYLHALVFVAWVMGTEPDYEKLNQFIARRGVRFIAEQVR